MITRILTFGLAFAGLASVAGANEIGFIEAYSLAEDRSQALEQLIPGTEDYYFYHCLYYQQQRRDSRLRNLLKLWIDRYGYTPQVKEILNRQALLTYEETPRKSLDHLIKELNVRFEHQRAVADQHPTYPTALDPDLISIPSLLRQTFDRYRNLEGVEDAGLDILPFAQLDAERRRDLLGRVRRPDIPGLPQLVIDDLQTRNSGGFGSMPIHAQLTLDQLDVCARRMPQLFDQTRFIEVYLTKLAPSNDVNLRFDPDQRRLHLQRLLACTRRLSPAHASLKAHVLHHVLAEAQRNGRYPRDLFMEYVQFPRSMPYMRRDYLRQASQHFGRVDLSEGFGGATRLEPVINDEALVRDYLSRFFLDARDTREFEPYIQDTYLTDLFVETKMVHGIGDQEQWYSLSTPAKVQSLKNRIDLAFSVENPDMFAADQSVALDVWVKNIDTLIVNVYRLNAAHVFRSTAEDITTAIDLDGLIASDQQVFTYREPPIRRVKRTFTFPQCDPPGVYVVDLIGNGVSSRAVIRKGRLQHLIRTGPAGYEFRVLDETHRWRTDATIWMGGQEYAADPEGVIFIPHSTAPGTQTLVLQAGERCSLATFAHRAAAYELTARFHVDPESLLPGARAEVVVRPVLTLNRHPISLSLLDDVTLTVTSTDADGAASSTVVSDFELAEERESLHAFSVPHALRSLSFELKAHVENLSTGEKQDLRGASTLQVNQIDSTLQVDDLHLRREAGGYALDLRGKNGEPRPDQPIQLALKHRYFRDPVHAVVQTDGAGRVSLGRLDQIVSIEAASPTGASRTWPLPRDSFAYPFNLHRSTREPVQIPYTGSPDAEPRLCYALLEKRGQTYGADVTDAVRRQEGRLVIQGLPAGEYELHLKEAERRVRLTLTNGEDRGDYIVSKNRLLDVQRPSLLHIEGVDVDPDGLTVRLAQAGPYSRVHVLADAYVPAIHPYGALSWGTPEPYVVPLAKAESQYVAGRNIGEEYRYILERKHAALYPGNMLERPELLLNPWAVRKTDTAVDEAEAGEAFTALATPPEARPAPGVGQAAAGTAAASPANLDFLASPSVLLANLRPDRSGRVRIERARLGDHPQIHILAVDPLNTAYRQVALAGGPAASRDLRLADPLDPTRHFTQQKRISPIEPGDTLRLEDISTSDIEIYETLDDAYRLFSTLSADPTLAEFAFLMRWPRLSEDEKLDKLSKYACHELHFFLYHKDLPFFDRAVKPGLAFKKDKTFLDHWLLEEDLSAFLEPWAFGRLNAVEQVLLAERGPGNPDRIARHLRERFELIPSDVDRFNRLFDVAMMGSALVEGGVRGFEDAKQEARMKASMAQQERGRMQVRATRKSAPPSSLSDLTAFSEEASVGAGVGGMDLNFAPEAERKTADAAAAGKERRAGFFDARDEARERVRALFRQVNATEEFAENNYYRRPIQEQVADLVPVNAFWNDYAGRDRTAMFLSPNFIYATRNFTDMLLALSVLELPFQAASHPTEVLDGAFTLAAGSPLVAFHREILPTPPAEKDHPILVAQRFFRSNDRYGYEGNERVDQFVEDEFLARTAYGCQVILTNPTSSRQKLTALRQIPAGSLPLQNGFETRSIPVTLEPYSTRTLETHFYFPEAGNFVQFPIHVGRNERLVAHAEPTTLRVVDQLSRVDTTSWSYVSQSGSEEEVLAYLRDHNLQRIDLDRIAWRMRDEAFFETVLELLRDRHTYHHTLWSYGLYHPSRRAAGEYLRHSEIAHRCGAALESPLLTIDPVERRSYQHLEYKPLINARAHVLGPERTILNNRLHQQYHAFLHVLRYRPVLDDHDRLGVVTYLFLQDRIDEALTMLSRIQPDRLHERIQYDYAALYAHVCRGETDAARSIAMAYVDYPVLRWRNRFAAALAQLDELAGEVVAVADSEALAQVQDQLAGTEPSFDFEVEDRRIRMTYRNLEHFEIHYYPMDIELLFSRNPFVQQQSDHFAYIQPHRSETRTAQPGTDQMTIELPEAFRCSNVMVEIVAGGLRKAMASYASQLSVSLVEAYGQVRVLQETTRKPLPATYVKVYARRGDGSVKFYRDGYTDLRGKFDYASLSTNDLDDTERFALLILHPEHGAVIREADPPQR